MSRSPPSSHRSDGGRGSGSGPGVGFGPGLLDCVGDPTALADGEAVGRGPFPDRRSVARSGSAWLVGERRTRGAGTAWRRAGRRRPARPRGDPPARIDERGQRRGELFDVGLREVDLVLDAVESETDSSVGFASVQVVDEGDCLLHCHDQNDSRDLDQLRGPVVAIAIRRAGSGDGRSPGSQRNRGGNVPTRGSRSVAGSPAPRSPAARRRGPSPRILLTRTPAAPVGGAAGAGLPGVPSSGRRTISRAHSKGGGSSPRRSLPAGVSVPVHRGGLTTGWSHRQTLELGVLLRGGAAGATGLEVGPAVPLVAMAWLLGNSRGRAKPSPARSTTEVPLPPARAAPLDARLALLTWIEMARRARRSDTALGARPAAALRSTEIEEGAGRMLGGGSSEVPWIVCREAGSPQAPQPAAAPPMRSATIRSA